MSVKDWRQYFDRVVRDVRRDIAGLLLKEKRPLNSAGVSHNWRRPRDSPTFRRPRLGLEDFANLTLDMKVVGKEIFDPVGVLIPFDSEEDAICIANDSEHGLLSVMRTQDAKRAHRVASRQDAVIRSSVSQGRNS